MRIGGLASGMDTEQIIKDLMKAERMPLNKLQQRRQYLEWQRNDLRDINKMLFEFDQLIFNGVSRQASFNKKVITSSNPNAVSVRNISSTNEISASIHVTKLATHSTMYSKGEILISDPNAKLSTQTGVTIPDTITIQAIGKDGNLQPPVSIDITGDDTLNTLINKINNLSGITTFYDAQTKQVSITSKNTGNVAGNSEIILTETNGFFTNTLMLDLNNDDADLNNVGSIGDNAEFTYNGMATSRSSNVFQINGFEYSLMQTTSQAVTFTSSPDVDSIYNSIKVFVDKYNELIETVNSKINERANRNYKPLTTEERESLSEKQIEQWEEQAKKGTLYRDQVLSSSLDKMRSALYTPVNGTNSISLLSQIGINTSSNYLDKGKLVIDEAKLRESIANNASGIYDLFQKDGATTNDQGLARRLRSNLRVTMGEIDKKAGKSTSLSKDFHIGRNLNNIDKQINSFESRLVQIENRYWKQFTAMEKALSKSNNQYAYLMQQFNSGM